MLDGVVSSTQIQVLPDHDLPALGLTGLHHGAQPLMSIVLMSHCHFPLDFSNTVSLPAIW